MADTDLRLKRLPNSTSKIQWKLSARQSRPLARNQPAPALQSGFSSGSDLSAIQSEESDNLDCTGIDCLERPTGETSRRKRKHVTELPSNFSAKLQFEHIEQRSPTICPSLLSLTNSPTKDSPMTSIFNEPNHDRSPIGLRALGSLNPVEVSQGACPVIEDVFSKFVDFRSRSPSPNSSSEIDGDKNVLTHLDEGRQCDLSQRRVRLPLNPPRLDSQSRPRPIRLRINRSKKNARVNEGRK